MIFHIDTTETTRQNPVAKVRIDIDSDEYLLRLDTKLIIPEPPASLRYRASLLGMRIDGRVDRLTQFTVGFDGRIGMTQGQIDELDWSTLLYIAEAANEYKDYVRILAIATVADRPRTFPKQAEIIRAALRRILLQDQSQNVKEVCLVALDDLEEETAFFEFVSTDSGFEHSNRILAGDIMAARLDKEENQ